MLENRYKGQDEISFPDVPDRDVNNNAHLMARYPIRERERETDVKKKREKTKGRVIRSFFFLSFSLPSPPPNKKKKEIFLENGSLCASG